MSYWKRWQVLVEKIGKFFLGKIHVLVDNPVEYFSKLYI